MSDEKRQIQLLNSRINELSMNIAELKRAINNLSDTIIILGNKIKR